MENREIVIKKIQEFFQKSFQYYGKEIILDTNQHFNINQIVDKENDEIYKYHIQYGFPQSGCISMKCSYEKSIEKFFIDDITIHAPSSKKQLIVANMVPRLDEGVVNLTANFGLDMKTEEHNNFTSILRNPNAIQLLDFAINDLNSAEVLGECCVGVPQGSDFIPCTISRIKDKTKNNLY